MGKIIEQILMPKPEARPRIYAYAIADKAHAGLLKVGQTTRNVKQRVAGQLRADQEMTSDASRMPNEPPSTSTFGLRPSNFAPALPGRLVSSTQIPVCLWFEAKIHSLEAWNDFRLLGSETAFSLVA